MKQSGFVAEPWVRARRCPFCHEALGSGQWMKFQISKVCKCRKCGKVIDRRNVWF